MKKTLLALLLALAMILALVGCGGGNADTPAPETQAPEANAPADNGPAEEPPADEPEAPPEEKTIEYPLSEETVTFTYWQAWPPFLSAISEPADAAIFAALEEITNVHLDVISVSTEQSSTELMLRCSSGQLTDMVQGMSQNYTGGSTKAYNDGLIIDLVPVLEEYSVNYWRLINEDPDILRGMCNDDGIMPDFNGMYTDYFYTDQGFFIRDDILKDEGLEIPTTIAELDEVLAAFKARGMTDPITVLATGECRLISTAYQCTGAVGNGGGISAKVIDGKLEATSGTDNEREYFKKMKEYYDLGYISKDFVTYTNSQVKPPEGKVESNNTGLFNEDPAALSSYYMLTDDPNFSLAPQGLIRVNEGDVMNNGYRGSKISNKYTMAVSTNCEDPGMLIQYLDYLYSEDGIILGNWGIEGETYIVNANGEKEFTDKITNNPEGLPLQLCQNLFINPGFACYTDLSVQEMAYNDCQKAAVPTWIAGFDSSDETLPVSFMTFTGDEIEEQAQYQSELETYMETTRLEFITGAKDANNDADWNKYVETLGTLHIDELIAISQAAYDRYMAR